MPPNAGSSAARASAVFIERAECRPRGVANESEVSVPGVMNARKKGSSLLIAVRGAIMEAARLWSSVGRPM